MKRKKNAMARAGVALLLSSSMTMNALASTVTTTGTVDVETTAGKNETVEVTIKIATSSNADGGYSVTTTTEEKDDKTDNNSLVDYNGYSKMDTRENGVTTGTENTKYEVTNGNYHAEGGSNTSVEANDDFIGKKDGIEVDVSLKDGGKNTASGSEVGTETAPTGKDTTKEDGNYDYTTETVVGQGSVTITTEQITFEETVNAGSADLEYVKSETTPDDTNDLVYAGEADDCYLPGYEGEAVIPDRGDEYNGYEYIYVGSGNTSKYFPAIVFNTPLSPEDKVAQYGENAYIKDNSITYYYVGWLPDEVKATIAKDSAGNYVTDSEGYILDINGARILKEERTTKDPEGKTLYLHRFDNYNDSLSVEGWYENGKWVKELNGEEKYTAVWSGPQQFILVDTEGNIITTYCADFTTPTQDNYGYNIENLEDADYYSKEEAAQIRSIVKNGYWGTGYKTDENGKLVLDEDGNPIPEIGSLEAMKSALVASGKFTEAELKSLNDGVALTATQMAIWSYSNKMSGLEFVNAHYSDWGTGNVPKDKEDEVKLMFKLYNYLINLDPTKVENTTQDTIVTKDNFVGDLSVTVVKKAEDHANNNDDDDSNDAYVANISFALVVQPSTENGDDLIVQIIDSNNNVLASGKIAGTPEDGIEMLQKGEDGNYAFRNIVMVEGQQNFSITMTGIQNLKEGVYLYSSEVKTENKEDVSSQTLVGMAEGERTVNVSMNIKFDLDVEDEIVATEHVWRKEWVESDDDNDGGDNKEKPTFIADAETPLAPMVMIEEEVPLSDVAVLGAFEIEDDMIPLAVLPATGDNSLFFMFMSFLSGLSLAGVSLVDKMKKHKR